jgi:acyl-CoA synthetase (AMP-forming)/AMP-acid ligase II
LPVPIYPPFRPDQIEEYAQRQRAILRNAGVQVLVTFADALLVAKLRPDDVTVSWLPLYHDMGLIGAWLGSLYHGVPLLLLSPLAFLSRPACWLLALHAYSGSVSAAPHFAFDLCVHKVADVEIQGLDLRRWRLTMNGSEAVSAETIERFIHRFAPFGFVPTAMCPMYGLAEASVALTMSPLDRAARVDAIARQPFERQREVHPPIPPIRTRFTLSRAACRYPIIRSVSSIAWASRLANGPKGASSSADRR